MHIWEHSLIERDLGVHVDSGLKFRQHVAAAVAKASQVLAVIKKSFEKKKRISHLLYVERLRTLCLPSPCYRPCKGDMIQTYQIIHGGVDIESANLFSFLKTDAPGAISGSW